MAKTHIIGFSRIGAKRELKFATEKFWRNEITEDALQETARTLRQAHWHDQQSLDFLTVGDFSFYDHVLDTSQRFNIIPKRFQGIQAPSKLTQYFNIARGFQEKEQTLAPSEMTKWFNTNYHYIVPELHQDLDITLHSQDLINQIEEAKHFNKPIKVTLLGPVSFLKLAKTTDHSKPLDYLEPLLRVYDELLHCIHQQGVEWVQFEEPALSLALDSDWQHAYRVAYHSLNSSPTNILIANYFGPLKDQLQLLCELPSAGIHIDAVEGEDEVLKIVDWLSSLKVLSLGVINGRNIWRTDLSILEHRLQPIRDRLKDRLWLSSSCSLLHVPVDASQETRLPDLLLARLAFGKQKIEEIALLGASLTGSEKAKDQIAIYSNQLNAAKAAPSSSVQQALGALKAEDYKRDQPFHKRIIEQQARLKLPELPTTTIGSFPQTDSIRKARKAFRSGELTQSEYDQEMKKAIQYCIKEQEAIGLDVLVHGEAERTDMVEYFGAHLKGFEITELGWVQSYGSRCVKPPIIDSDIEWSKPITTSWIQYAQSLTDKPVKGMLTGPVTLLNWSFVRDDQPKAITAQQLALAIQKEVKALEAAGISIIQIDEAALREGLPLRKEDWNTYLSWAIASFKLATSCVNNATQIHTHMCYSNFNDIFSSIAEMDADVITIETARSSGRLLRAFKAHDYKQHIGPGVYDIHSKNIPSSADIKSKLEDILEYLDTKHVWVNPDCGLKTRKWEEVKPALINLITATQSVRNALHTYS